MKRACVGAVLLLLPRLLGAQEEPQPDAGPPPRFPSGSAWLFGGTFGFGLGDVIFVSVSPTVGYAVSPRVHLGASLTFRYTDDQRYSPSFSYVDYGAGAFVRTFVFDRAFAQVGYEYLSYEQYVRDGSTERRGASSILVGGGFAQPLGGRAAMVFELLYNLTYDSAGPYARPLTLRIGVTSGF